MSRLFLLALVGAAAAFAAPRQEGTPAVIVRAGTLIDGRGAVLRNREIVIEGGKITAVRAKENDARLPAGAVVYDLRGMTVMPGWIDTHVHLDWHFDKNNKLASKANESPADDALYAAENAWLTLEGGFTTVQSVGAPIDAEVRDRIAGGYLPGPRILTSLIQITGKSGDPKALRALVRKTKAEGADVIKLFATQGLAAGGAQSMTDAQIQAVCGEAKAQGLRSVVHAVGAEGARAAILAGCTSIEHGDFVDSATLDLMKEHGVYFDPNFLVLHNYLDRRGSFDFPAQSFDALAAALKPTAEVLRNARRHGVKVVFGTDAVAGAHGHNADEFIYRVRDGGDSPMQAIVSATSLAAESLALADRIGTVAPGFAADLTATDGNPLDDITAVRRVAFVMRNGRVYKNRPAGTAAKVR